MNPGATMPARRRLLACALAIPLALALTPCARADLVSTLARVKPSVVGVGTYQRTRSPAFVFRGTGFAVGDGMSIATNAHVLPDQVDSAKLEQLVVVLPGDGLTGAVRPVRVVASERAQDLALLRLESGPALPALRLAGGGGVVEGQEVAFTGFPIGAVLGMTPVTHRGIVSAITPIAIPQANSRDLNPALIRRLATDPFRVYQLDATAYPGNSGSPLYDPATGEVIGVLNMVFVKSTKEKVLSDPSGISYAIPAEYLQRLIASQR